MNKIKQEEFYGIIEDTYCDLINNSTNNDTNFTYQEVKIEADIYKEGEITKNITTPYRDRSQKLKMHILKNMVVNVNYVINYIQSLITKVT